MNAISSVDKSCDTPLLLTNLKLKNANILILGHLNINSIVGKFDHFKVLENNIDILVLTETKIDLVSLMLNLGLTDSQHLSNLTKINLVVKLLFMFDRTYLASN